MTMALPAFKRSEFLTLGVELELQILDPNDYGLSPSAPDLLFWVGRQGTHPGSIGPEITQGMIEISTGIQQTHEGLLFELNSLRDFLARGARELNLRLCGGGTHPFQHWGDNRISSGERYRYVSDLYGYLAKQFTVFGQHIHVGCRSGDEALWLLHALSRYVPHLIALSASSPFLLGRDTHFASSRLNSVFAFPLSGRAPMALGWQDFVSYFEKMARTGMVSSMKDFYWDIRPKPEFGTIEVRVCDTPLTVEHAADLAAYVQVIAYYLLTERPFAPSDDDYLVYTFNRFQASRFGLSGTLVDPKSAVHTTIGEDIRVTLAAVESHASELGADKACARLAGRVTEGRNDAEWIRHAFEDLGSLPEMIRAQSGLWTEHR
jgi:carboxylate-amine ligase